MIDLHMHSAYSDDGEYTPTQLVEMCAAQGITTMSITDHNSTRANAEAEQAAKRLCIHYVSGIEIDCTFEGSNFHVLGYGIDYQAPDFAAIEEYVAEQSRGASLEMLRLTQGLGFAITIEDIQALERDASWAGRWTGEMFAELLLSLPEYKENTLLKPYRTGGSRSDNPFVNFYWDFYAQGKPCYVKVVYPQLVDIIKIVHQHHGKTILAHPEANLKNNPSLFPKLMALDLDGLEAFSTYHNPEQCAHYYDEALRHKKVFTCGSDFHGKTKPSITLGGIPYPDSIDRNAVEEKIANWIKNSFDS